MKPRNLTRIVITGFMGAGKSSVARELARLLHDSFVDLDDEVTRAEGRTPRELIDEEGEPYFREAETRALRAALEEGTARVIALGGGAVSCAATRELLARRNCLTIWLDAPFESCWQRIAEDDARPFARDRETARRLYEERRKFYSLADYRVEIGAGRSIESVTSEIREVVRSRND
ncbi:MAG: shikimate kinase [Acidobacteriota bacterium]|nr:shikimate kinase [Acidobacteriota bacterium]